MMKWKSCLLMLFFPVGVWSFSPVLTGRWRPQQGTPNVAILVEEDTVTGIMGEKQSVEMEIIEKHEDKLVLDRIRVRQKPADWFNVVKYREFIVLFNTIQQHGVVCGFSFIGKDSIEISPQIGEKTYNFILERVL